MGLSVNIVKAFGDFTLEVAFETGEEIFAVLGESGCGKSLTLKCIAGIEKPDSGRICLNDRVLYDSGKGIDLPPRERRVGYLFQQYALFPNMTVAANIGVAVPKGEREAVVADFIRDFALEGLESKYPRMLSGGQQQRVALARMLAAKPELILLDEPFSALDHNLKMTLELQVLEVFEKYHTPMLFVSHNRDEVYSLCSRMGIISQGKMERVGTKEAVFHDPITVSGANITGCKNIATVEPVPGGQVDCPEWGFSLIPQIDGRAHLGIRAHDIEILCRTESSAPIFIKGKIECLLELPFEGNAVVRVEVAGAQKGRLVVAVEKSKMSKLGIGQPVTLGLDPERLLWLE
ncbi:sulfate/molybdate ABC transporter ATP-binding protein [Eubacterium sp.]|uniref:sulfate/molybdate ABC transporter ATP-binding protein n=1 Tax=Eubacterium sp. TaxID=142586 RepID=UPI002FC8D666